MNRNHLQFITLLFGLTAFSTPQSVRWTGSQDKDSAFDHILSEISKKTSIALTPSDFLLVEDRSLDRMHFKMYSQAIAGIPRMGLSLRIWTWKGNDETVQVEARVESVPIALRLETPSQLEAFSRRAQEAREGAQAQNTFAAAREIVRAHREDSAIVSIKHQDAFKGAQLVRVITVKSRHGQHVITFALPSGKLLEKHYSEFPQADAEFSLPAEIYPVYEQPTGSAALLARKTVSLNYLQSQIVRPTGNPYAPLLVNRYFENKVDPVLGLTAEGRSRGFWSPGFVKAEAAKIIANLPRSANSVTNPEGALLVGRYAVINLHPDAPAKFTGLGFTPLPSTSYMPRWQAAPDVPNANEMIPSTGFFGKPILSQDDVLNRVAQRLPNHDTAAYIRDGFDEAQVYYAINQLFESLVPMGFTDPDLSERPFNAFLYDPEISYRDNAYYTDDTINFTTYSPQALNYARDNTTIWHELGHGLMDRLMGDFIVLADTGGLSEGMADFVAQLVLLDVTNNDTFPGKENMRIFNQTGFFLTNEVHDDGEAYGGAMNDFLVSMVESEGKVGLTKVANLTMDAMRLARNHPALTASDWFEHMLFADELGHAPYRAAGELRNRIIAAVHGRNFDLAGATPASMAVQYSSPATPTKQFLGSTGPGSRQAPISYTIRANQMVQYTLDVKLASSVHYSFKYPVTVKVDFHDGALQGAIHWEGESASPVQYTLKSEADTLQIPLKARGVCDSINRSDGSCVDYAYIQIWNNGDTYKPVAKKRFYLQIHPK